MTLQLSNPMRQMLAAWGSDGSPRRFDMARDTKRHIGVVLEKDASGTIQPKLENGEPIYVFKRAVGRNSKTPSWTRATPDEMGATTFISYRNAAWKEYQETGEPAAFFRSSGQRSMMYYPPQVERDNLAPGEDLMPRAFDEAVDPSDAYRTGNDPPASRQPRARTPDHLSVGGTPPPTVVMYIGPDGLPVMSDGSIDGAIEIYRPGSDEWKKLVHDNLTPDDLNDTVPKPLRDEVMGGYRPPVSEPSDAPDPSTRRAEPSTDAGTADSADE